ncbi:hypothetical protein I316_04386 [Kwoniella heveanensis BCC8398]|uniref:Uncharacterized protein n=1 Tax=Kwoniella heveanensis BCC8398 TaxID=1296120 RepID=A0A1B9GSJ4_9TREE|nr:hypothetical protein I316_04386 [Kwoniella heveanensis BCC8398]
MPDPSSYGDSQVQASLETDHLDINTLYGRENGYEGGVGQYFGGYDQPSSGADLAAQQQAFVEASTYAGPKEVEAAAEHLDFSYLTDEQKRLAGIEVAFDESLELDPAAAEVKQEDEVEGFDETAGEEIETSTV